MPMGTTSSLKAKVVGYQDPEGNAIDEPEYVKASPTSVYGTPIGSAYGAMPTAPAVVTTIYPIGTLPPSLTGPFVLPPELLSSKAPFEFKVEPKDEEEDADAKPKKITDPTNVKRKTKGYACC